MPKVHTVKQGECINSIAFAEGLMPKKIWEDPGNDKLRKDRPDRNILMRKDSVAVPDVSVKEESKSVDKIHEFKLLNALVKLNLTLLYYDEPVKNESYVLRTDDSRQYRGDTSSAGKIEVTIPAYCNTAELTVGTGEKQLKYNLSLGHLDPTDEVSGFKMRMENLGFAVGGIDDTESQEFERALKLFESENGLEVSGKRDVKNQQKIEELYGR